MGSLRTGEINAYCQQYGVPGFPAPTLGLLHSSQSDRMEMATEAVLSAMPQFEVRVLEKGKWDPDRAALETYFVGAAVMALADVHKRWWRDRARRLEELDIDSVRIGFPDSGLSLETRLRIDELRGVATPDERDVLDLLCDGWSQVEVADHLRITPAAVNIRLRRLRRKAVKA